MKIKLQLTPATFGDFRYFLAPQVSVIKGNSIAIYSSGGQEELDGIETICWRRAVLNNGCLFLFQSSHLRSFPNLQINQSLFKRRKLDGLDTLTLSSSRKACFHLHFLSLAITRQLIISSNLGLHTFASISCHSAIKPTLHILDQIQTLAFSSIILISKRGLQSLSLNLKIS